MSSMRELIFSAAVTATVATALAPESAEETAVYDLMSARRPSATAKVDASSAELATRRPLDTWFCTVVSSAEVARRYFCDKRAPTLVTTEAIVLTPDSGLDRGRFSPGAPPVHSEHARKARPDNGKPCASGRRLTWYAEFLDS